MTFEEILDQAIAMLQRRGRLTYSTLKRQFQLDDAALEDVKNELIEGQRVAVDERGNVLVWTGGTDVSPHITPPAPQPGAPPDISDAHRTPSRPAPAAPGSPDAERRHLTVLFCDLVESTALASYLDPEDLRAVVRAYQATCAEVIQHFAGHIAQYLGDGLLVYFGYPQAHEDDAQRAVRSGLGMIEAMGTLNTRLEREYGVRLAVRLGIHTGLVVVGEIGSGERQEQLALGETPNIAARLQGLAAPDTVVISEATDHLIHGYFVCQPLGAPALKGVPQPLPVYQVLQESGAQTRLDVATARGLTPLVGRAEEVALLQRRWDQAATGMGQVVLLSGEAGIGKSRLVQVLKEHVTSVPHTRIEWRGSPDHQQSALYPVIDQLQRLLRGAHEVPPAEPLRILEAALTASGMALSETVPLLAALLSLPLPDSYPPLALTPQRQRQKTLQTLLTWLHTDAQRQPVLLIVEDLHWIDPSTMGLLSLLMEQCAPMRLCLVLTARPELHPPWTMVAHFTALTQLVEAEVVVQRGLPPQAIYTFKHALIQDAAYESLLRSTRQQYHQRIAQVLAERFPETAETQPEVVAQHYTAAGLHAQAIAAGQRALTLATASGDGVMQALANQYLGTFYHSQGDYRRTIDCCRQTIAYFDGVQHYERFGATLPPVNSRAWLAWGHAELGTFPEGSTFGDEGLRIAEAVNHPASLLLALWGSGLLALRQGNLPSALPLLERAMGLCQDADLRGYFPRLAAPLGAAYTLGGRVADAVAAAYASAGTDQRQGTVRL